jgi:phosphoribosylformylglycinamidine cyclo-ligase
MRADVAVRYEISVLPQVPEVLQYLADQLGFPAAETYSTLNMGAGYVAIVAPEDAEEALRMARKAGHDALVAGEVTEGQRALAIPSLGIEYRDDDFQLR